LLNKFAVWTKNSWDWLQLLIFVVLAPVFLFPRIERAWIFIIIPVVWLVSWRCRGVLLTRTALDLSILLLSFQVLITCFIVPDIWVSLPKISGFLYGLVVFYAIIFLLKNSRFIHMGIHLFMLGSIFFAALGLLGMRRMELHVNKKLDLLMNIRDRVPVLKFNLPGAELGFHPNAVGGTLVLMIPLLLVFFIWFAKKNKRLMLMAGLFLLVEIGILLLTLSRGSWLAVFIASLFIVLQFVKKKRLIVLISLLFLTAAVVSYVALVGPRNIRASSNEIEGKILSRGQLWAWGADYVDQHPVTGIGMNQVRMNPWVQYHTSHLHNQFVHTAAELGLPGLIAYLAILLGAGFMSIEVWRKERNEYMRLAVLGLGSGQLAFMIFGIADSVPLGAKSGIIFWISLALITGIYNHSITAR